MLKLIKKNESTKYKIMYSHIQSVWYQIKIKKIIIQSNYITHCSITPTGNKIWFLQWSSEQFSGLVITICIKKIFYLKIKIIYKNKKSDVYYTEC